MWDHSSDTEIIIKKFLLFFSPSIRMSGKNINSDDKKIKKKKNFYKNKKAFKIDDIDTNRLLASKEESDGKKIHLNI